MAWSAPPQFLILSPSSADNSLGRALALADILGRLGHVEVVAYDVGPVWKGAASWQHDVTIARTFGDYWRLLARARRRASEVFVVTVKPLPASLGIGLLLRAVASAPDVTLVMDVDEDDVVLRQGTLEALTGRDVQRRRLRMLRRPDVGDPATVRILTRLGVARAGLLTASSGALAEHILGGQKETGAIVPHARPSRPYLPPRPADHHVLRLGFLGTARAYKGVGVFEGILSSLPHAELHLLGQEIDPSLHEFALQGRVILHQQTGLQTLEQAYTDVDVILLPQDASAPQTALQLPAKLIDALMFGRPVLATPTAPILEIAGRHVTPILDWRAAGATLTGHPALSTRDGREELGRAANAYARDHLSVEAVAAQLGARLGGLAGRRT